MSDTDELDEREWLEQQYQGSNRERKTTRQRGRKPSGAAVNQAKIEQLAEPSAFERGFVTTYQPGLFEEGWLLNSLMPFYEEHLISDVLASVKGGKEASVYCCTADPSLNLAPPDGETTPLLAAKVYRPRQFRNLRNDKMYREGRLVLTEEGRPVKANDHRLMRAIGKKTATGVQASHTSWLMYEYTTLQRLHKVGAAVPKPYGVNSNALLMEYLGFQRMAAPILNSVSLARAEARRLFEQVLHNIELMLGMGLIHGDLSAYNILYWEGRIILIDFPQVTYSQSNAQAYAIFTRDIQRVCDYFQRQGVKSKPGQLTTDLWARFAALDPQDAAADLSARLDPHTYGADPQELRDAEE